ncbi:MAG: type I methionyl aminopeptidase [Chitinophagales bacterium]
MAGGVKIKTNEEVELMRQSGAILAETIAIVASHLKPGVNGLQLDKIADDFIRSKGAVASFKGYHGFPAALCISPNEDVVHGVPNARVFKDGDIVSIDAGVFLNGFHADSAYTFAIGNVKEPILKLLRVTKQSLYLGIEKAIAGNRIGAISSTIQNYCEREHGYRCVRELVGHGLGRDIHEDPQVPNYGKPNDGGVLKENTVIAIEPMVNLGRKDVYTKNDNWTVATQDHKPSAHFEHTVCVRAGKADILTSFSAIEAAIKSNQELVFI